MALAPFPFVLIPLLPIPPWVVIGGLTLSVPEVSLHLSRPSSGVYTVTTTTTIPPLYSAHRPSSMWSLYAVLVDLSKIQNISLLIIGRRTTSTNSIEFCSFFIFNINLSYCENSLKNHFTNFNTSFHIALTRRCLNFSNPGTSILIFSNFAKF